MRLLHLGDLHFGKRINTLSLLEDQQFICDRILEVIDSENVDAVMICGDVYDKSVPAEEAVSMLDDFLYKLSLRQKPVMIVSGNHDSVERLSFGDRIIQASGIYISPRYDGKVRKVVLSDEYGDVSFYLLPFVKPATVRAYFPDKQTETYTQAAAAAIEQMNVNPEERNVILSHQFVTGAGASGSEDELSVGGITNVDSSVYDVFDYAALGHIHGPQFVGRETLRYCGSPMKFSFNEEKQNKELTIVNLGKKGSVTVESIPLEPMRDFVTIKGKYDELMLGRPDVRAQDFVRAVLLDEDDVPNAYSNLAQVYPNIISLAYDNRRTRNTDVTDGGEIDVEVSPYELFESFYMTRNSREMSAEQAEYVKQLIQRIWEEQ